jgi:hypothetical protein
MTVSVQFNSDSFIKAMNYVSQQSGLSMQTILRSQMSLWAKSLVRMTYPKKKTDGEKAIFDYTAGKLKGDLGRLFKPIPDNEWKDNENFFETVAGENIPAGTYVFKAKTGAVYGVENDYVVNDIDSMRQHHQKNRGKNGRVTRAGSYTRDVGRWKFVDKYHVKWSMLRQYAKEVMSHVGREKAGWLMAANYFNSKSDKLIDKGRIPNWVDRHEEWAISRGGYKDTVQPQKMAGEVVAYSSVEWAHDDGLMRKSLNARLNDLQKYMLKRIQKNLDKIKAKGK